MNQCLTGDKGPHSPMALWNLGYGQHSSLALKLSTREKRLDSGHREMQAFFCAHQRGRCYLENQSQEVL